WEEATPQTATTGPCRFGTQNTWQSSANDGGSYASPAGLASNTSQPVGSSSSACTPIPGASSSRSHPYSLSAAGVFPPSCQQSVLTNDPPVSPSIPGAPTHLARQNVWQSIPTGNGNGRRTVTLEDLADLGREGTSLSDSVVDFWMSLLVARKKLSPPPRPLAGMFLHQDTPSSLPSLSQAAVTSTTLFMQPLFDSAENHYACTVVKRGRIYYCDSSCMSSQPSNGMMELLRRIYGAEAEVTVLPTQQQTPMSALCGAFTLAFCTEFLLGGVQPGKVNLRESDMRNHIIACVEERRAKQFPRMLPGDEPPIFSRRKKIKLYVGAPWLALGRRLHLSGSPPASSRFLSLDEYEQLLLDKGLIDDIEMDAGVFDETDSTESSMFGEQRDVIEGGLDQVDSPMFGKKRDSVMRGTSHADSPVFRYKNDVVVDGTDQVDASLFRRRKGLVEYRRDRAPAKSSVDSTDPPVVDVY
ncbi:hypothetical protein FOL46_002428, partial [Perkinsus olseni]